MVENLLIFVVLLPLLGCCFVAASRDGVQNRGRNSLYSAILTVITNIFLIIWLFSGILQTNNSIVYQFGWNILPPVEIALTADALSMLFVLSVQLALFVGLFSLRHESVNRKEVLFFVLMYLSALNGYFFAQNFFTFYFFFSLTIIPMMMQLGFGQRRSEKSGLLGFYIVNIGSGVLLWCALLYLSVYDISVSDKSFLFKGDSVWALSFILTALIMRLPVWPFSGLMAESLKRIDNPLVFICLNILPATGIYGLIRFWPNEAGGEFYVFEFLLTILCFFTMLAMAYKIYWAKNLREKLFDYATVYYLLYVLAAFLPTDILQINIGYAVFSFLILLSLFSAVVFHIHQQSVRAQMQAEGILCLLPKTSFIYGMTILAALGLPITAMFWNNFIILSEIFDFNFGAGNVVMFSLAMVAVALLNNFYFLKKRLCFVNQGKPLQEIDLIQFSVYILTLVVLFLSFIKPLWFIV